jgi:Ala-tRNA(Pro) deacylase
VSPNDAPAAPLATVFDRLVALLTRESARFRVIEHVPEGRSEQIAKIRGNRPEQAAKAMVLQIRGDAPGHVLAILSGNRRIDFAAAAKAVGGRKASFAAADEAQRLTSCAMGAVPPFTFDPERLPLIVDPDLLQNDSLYFNAGRLDRSIECATADWLRIARPAVHQIALP